MGSGLDDQDLLTPYVYTQLETRGNNSAIADQHTLQFTDTEAQGFSDFTSCILGTDL
jgi:hypothetical protein